MMNRIYLNDDWFFSAEWNTELTDKSTKEDELEKVRLPHAVKELPFHYFHEKEYQMICGYRRHLYVPKEWKDKVLLLTVDGACHGAELFVNGTKVLFHGCGYTAFSVDIAPYVRVGEDNILAVKLARGGKRSYIATMIPSDEEDRERIRRHIADRDGLGFETIECGRDIASCLAQAELQSSFLLDSVTALLMNELYPNPKTWALDPTAPERCEKGLLELCGRVSNLVLVSDYIYSDAAKYDEETETFRKGLARLDRALARIADTVIEVSAGNLILLKGVLPQ